MECGEKRAPLALASSKRARRADERVGERQEGDEEEVASYSNRCHLLIPRGSLARRELLLKGGSYFFSDEKEEEEEHTHPSPVVFRLPWRVVRRTDVGQTDASLATRFSLIVAHLNKLAEVDFEPDLISKNAFGPVTNELL
eukprot:scaffold53196_cov28-Tisochrysis_lutea.AAC.8